MLAGLAHASQSDGGSIGHRMVVDDLNWETSAFLHMISHPLFVHMTLSQEIDYKCSGLSRSGLGTYIKLLLLHSSGQNRRPAQK